MQSHADPLPGAILIVEDDAGVAELIAELLREQGCLTAHAATGAEALTWLAGHRPALVLLDYALPDMTGLQFLDRAGAPLPFIVTTGAGDERTAVELMKHGARDYVIKGTGFLANLTLAVRRVLNHLATERQLAQVREALLLSEARQKADQRRAEADREHMRAQLLQAQKLESIGTLASGVAHEINNPIMGIMGYAQLILDRLGPDSPVAGYATEIVRESDRVAMIVKHLLSFARSESQLASPARAYDIVEDTLSLVRAVLRHDQIAIEVDVPADLPLLTCRSQQIRQVVMNMLTNARDALNQRYPGHAANKVVRISARVIEKAVSSGQSAVNSEQSAVNSEQSAVSSEQSAVNSEQPAVNTVHRSLFTVHSSWLRLTFEDHGTGIPEDVRERIFDPFFSTKPRDKGTGLGLSISHGIVKDHGGVLSVESEAGQWTRFHVDLPIA